MAHPAVRFTASAAISDIQARIRLLNITGRFPARWDGRGGSSWSGAWARPWPCKPKRPKLALVAQMQSGTARMAACPL